jgi:hypothetical protein
MKMVMICYNEAIDDEVMEVFTGCGLTAYTKLMGVFGKGRTSGTHLGNDIWPGRNNILYVACEDAAGKQLLSCVRAMRNQYGAEGIKAFSWKLEEIS